MKFITFISESSEYFYNIVPCKFQIAAVLHVSAPDKNLSNFSFSCVANLLPTYQWRCMFQRR